MLGPMMGTALTLDCSISATGKSEAIAERVLKNIGWRFVGTVPRSVESRWGCLPVTNQVGWMQGIYPLPERGGEWGTGNVKATSSQRPMVLHRVVLGPAEVNSTH